MQGSTQQVFSSEVGNLGCICPDISSCP